MNSSILQIHLKSCTQAASSFFSNGGSKSDWVTKLNVLSLHSTRTSIQKFEKQTFSEIPNVALKQQTVIRIYPGSKKSRLSSIIFHIMLGNELCIC